MGEDNAADDLSSWSERGAMSKLSIVQRLDYHVREFLGLTEEERGALEMNFASNGPLSEDIFISRLRGKAAVDVPYVVGRRLYNTIAYVAQVPFVDEHAPATLSTDQLARALAWLLPDRHTRITHGIGNWSARRTPRDFRRLLFQSLAGIEEEHENNNQTEGQQKDADKEGLLIDMLDVLYATQPQPAGFEPVPRVDFTPIAERFMQRQRIICLHAQKIPQDEFVALVRVLLALQTEPALAPPLPGFDDAVAAIATAFCHEGDIVTWPQFDHAMATVAPFLFNPLYRLVSETLIDQNTSNHTIAIPIPRSIFQSTRLLNPPVFSQLLSFLRLSIAYPDLRLCHRSAGPNQYPKPTYLARTLQSVKSRAVMLLAGRQGIFGIFSPQPRKDVSVIQPLQYKGVRCGIFQVRPVHDFFQGAERQPGWTEESESVVRFGKEGAGVSLILRQYDGGLRAELQHCSPARNIDELAYNYEANPLRADWRLDLDVQEVEIWDDSSRD